MAVKAHFQQQYDALTEEFGAWSDLNDFPEDLRADEILNFWGKELPEADRAFLEDFIDRWFTLADEHLKTEFCHECRRYTPDSVIIVYAGRDVCPQCAKRLKTEASEKAARAQPSLFMPVTTCEQTSLFKVFTNHDALNQLVK